MPGNSVKESCSQLHSAADVHGMPVGKLVTNGYTADWTQAVELMRRINEADKLLADRAGSYDTSEIIEYCEAEQIEFNLVIMIKTYTNTNI